MRGILILALMTGSLAFAQESANNSAIAGPTSFPVASSEVASALPDAPQMSSSILPIMKSAVIVPQIEYRKAPSAMQKKIWMSLMVAEHGAATFDAFTTRKALDNGAHEVNPLLRPFASSAAIYPVIQLFPVAMDYLGFKLMHSQNQTLRKLWWIPQTASTAGSIAAGVHNIGN